MLELGESYWRASREVAEWQPAPPSQSPGPGVSNGESVPGAEVVVMSHSQDAVTIPPSHPANGWVFFPTLEDK